MPDWPSVTYFAGKYKDNEAIEFSFDLNKDVPEDVAQEMVWTTLTVWEEVRNLSKTE